MFKTEIPDGLIVFAMWEEEGRAEFQDFVSVDAVDELHHRAFLKRAYIKLQDYIDKMNKDMINKGIHSIIPESDMLEWRTEHFRRN